MLISEVLKQKQDMTAIEELLADYFLNMDLSKKESARAIAKKIGTAPSTVTRFTKRLGFAGYNDFIEAFVKEQNYLTSHFEDINPNYPFSYRDKNTVVANKIGHLYNDIIADTLALLTHDDLNKALTLIRQSKNIIIISGGVQADVARTFEDKMLRIGKKVMVESQSYKAFLLSEHATHDTLFIVISYSGETEGVLRVARNIVKRQLPLLAITSVGDNSLSRLAVSSLYVSSKEKLFTNLGTFSMNLSVLLILDTLYVCVFNEDYTHNYEAKVTSSKGYDVYRQSNNPYLKDY